MPPKIAIIRCSRDIAQLLGARPCPRSPGGLDLVDPRKDIFVWTREGDRLVWAKAAPLRVV